MTERHGEAYTYRRAERGDYLLLLFGLKQIGRQRTETLRRDRETDKQARPDTERRSIYMQRVRGRRREE